MVKAFYGTNMALFWGLSADKMLVDGNRQRCELFNLKKCLYQIPPIPIYIGRYE